ETRRKRPMHRAFTMVAETRTWIEARVRKTRTASHADPLPGIRSRARSSLAHVAAFLRARMIFLAVAVSLSATTVHAQHAAYVHGLPVPWGASENELAMRRVFGAGWEDIPFDQAGHVFDVGTGSDFQFVFVEGGDQTAQQFADFLSANEQAID